MTRCCTTFEMGPHCSGTQPTFVELPVQGVPEPGLAGVTAGVIDGGGPRRINSHELLAVPVLILLKPECHIPDRADLAEAGVILDLLNTSPQSSTPKCASQGQGLMVCIYQQCSCVVLADAVSMRSIPKQICH